MAKHRGSNEGSIFQRTDGRWCAVLNLGWENGRRRRKCLYGNAAGSRRSPNQGIAGQAAGLTGRDRTPDCRRLSLSLACGIGETLRPTAHV
jgi:integrase